MRLIRFGFTPCSTADSVIQNNSLSLRSNDKKFVRRLVAYIEAGPFQGRGLFTWLDEEEIRLGQSVPGVHPRYEASLRSAEPLDWLGALIHAEGLATNEALVRLDRRRGHPLPQRCPAGGDLQASPFTAISYHGVDVMEGHNRIGLVCPRASIRQAITQRTAERINAG